MKEAVGKTTNNSKLKTEGKVDRAAGKVKDAAAKTKDAARDATEKIQKELHKKH
ncbi:MAG: CsbD family protein [Clostridiales bacterium]|nr:CsbD family protein [Clostridiales bacterium]